MIPWPPEIADRVRHAFLTRGDSVTDMTMLGEAVGVRDVVYAQQIHGSKVEVIDRPSHGRLQCDALVTSTKNLALVIQAADCQNFAVYCSDQHVLAVIHAGWRGLAQKVITATYDVLRDRFHIDPGQSYVWAGPSLCKQCSAFTDPRAELPSHLHPFIDGKLVDLRAAADREFVACGMPLDHLVRHPDCTKCEDHLYWSHRARNYDAAAAHRQGDVYTRNFLIASLW